MGRYQQLANKIGELVDEKNKAYGNSFGEVGDFLRILYPTGIPPEAYTDALCIVRIFDKLKRIATAKDAFGESPYQDIVGYALLGTQKDIDKRVTSEAKKFVKNNEFVAFNGHFRATPEMIEDFKRYYGIDVLVFLSEIERTVRNGEFTGPVELKAHGFNPLTKQIRVSVTENGHEIYSELFDYLLDDKKDSATTKT